MAVCNLGKWLMFSAVKFKRVLAPVLTLALTFGLIFPTALNAWSYTTTGLMFYFDFSNMASTSTGTALSDLSGNNRNGTIRGNGLTFDAANKALQFPGGSNGSNYVELGGDFKDFSAGVTIEFEGEFGAVRSPWERIFDFGGTFTGTSSDNQFWVGQLNDSNELAIETWIDGANQGRCHTVVSGGALGATSSRTFAKWVITVGKESGTTKCRIYKDGNELPTQIQSGGGYELGSVVETGGSAYPLPKNVARTGNYLGRSNWPDADFEGSIKYLRIYSTALTPTEVKNNAVTTYAVTYDEHGGSVVPDGTFKSGGTLTYPTDPTKSGYTFLGWFAAASGGTARTSSAVATDNASVTLHAQWSANTYNVSYDEHGGSTVADGSYTFGNTLAFPTSPTRSGYSFNGWFAAASGGSALTAASVSAGTSDVTLHAQWTALPTQTLTWAPTNTTVQTNQSPITPSNLATTNGNGTITYSVVNAGATGCSVNSTTGVITFSGVGNCVVRASASATTSYADGFTDVTYAVTSTSPALSLNLALNTGDVVANSRIDYGASGLMSNTAWTLVLRSTPQTIASGTYNGSVLGGSAQIPSGLPAGWHSITLTGVSPSGSTLSHAVWFEVSSTGTLLQTAGTDPEPTVQAVAATAGLAETGRDLATQFFAALALMLLGAGLVLSRQRLKRSRS